MNKVETEKPIKKSRSSFAIIMLFVVVAIFVFGVTFGIHKKLTSNDNLIVKPEQTSRSQQDEVNDATSDMLQSILPIDFQPIIDKWAGGLKGTATVLIYDLDLDRKTAEYNIAENYNTASLYKLFVVYEGYKRVENKTWDGDTKAGSTDYTILECLDLAIRESNSLCAETLWKMIGHDNLNAIIENEWGIMHSDISKLTSNATDIAAILKRFYEHPDFNNEALLAKMWDSFLNQPITTYNWRQGLPSGFKKASVYNKVGWDYNPDKKYWNIYHDAAIVKFPTADGNTRNFIIVVMTNRVDYLDIKKLATLLENKFYEE
ncbi:serine hydrolase [Candidatus Saccharibacteria bacterium]|nr:serine hydrolase [Candidatus Saccharibacteria bacterium]